MNVTTNEIPDLACRVVLAVSEERCDVRQGGVTTTVGFARGFPTPRIERVAPGNLVAVADAGQGAGVLVWRWYDAVVLGEQGGAVRLWEPFHGEVLARVSALASLIARMGLLRVVNAFDYGSLPPAARVEVRATTSTASIMTNRTKAIIDAR